MTMAPETVLALPTEIIIHVFQIAACSSRLTALTLSQVATWVRECVLKEFWSVMVLGEDDDENYTFQTTEGEKTLRSPIPFQSAPIFCDTATASPHSVAIIQVFYETILRCLSSWTYLPPSYPEVALLDTLALSRLRRLSIPVSLMPTFTQCDTTLSENLKELHIQSGLRDSNHTSLDRAHLALRSAIDRHYLTSLTHLHLPNSDGMSPRGRLLMLCLNGIVKGLPSLTHLALDCAAVGIFEEDFSLSTFMENNKTGRTLQCILLLIRQSSFDDTMTSAWREQLEDTFRVDAYGERLLVMWISADWRDDWKLWERLAREDRNVWDEALMLHRRRRSLDSSNTLALI